MHPSPQTTSVILGTVLVVIGGALAAGGGLGGGGLFVPLFVLVLHFPAHAAVPLSKATIFGTAVAAFILNVRRRHPTSDRPLIDFDASMILEPMTLVGTIVGVFFNIAFPSWLVIILLWALLGFTAFRSLRKGIRMWKKETKRKPEHSDSAVQLADMAEDKVEEEDGTPLLEATVNDDLEAVLKAERNLPKRKLVWLAVVWIMILTICFLKGGHGAPSVIGVQRCSWQYWLLVALTVPIVIVFTLAVGRQLCRDTETKIRCDYPFGEGDIRWTRKNTVVYPLLCGLAGIAAGLLGIGGGMVKGPLLLELGMLAQVAAPTSHFMILFTSSSTTLQFVVLGVIRLDYCLWYMFWGFVAALIGKLGIDRIIKRLGRPSIIVLCVGSVITLACVFMGIEGIITTVKQVQSGGYMGFVSLCE